ncbi:FAD-dependent oxidoreductase [Apilactobacillus bombintestini]|uniref:FAD-dependent oxidoreductase n=1 Tax=Apilactobacillus bombintestini TaxID=2419772 RepID=A0A387AQ46_9LACO|nr:FAD-dependent oxidoreductase [Apilactobacillus bombintestini]AYF92113.1 FAD-dependent oxidoreductase [Apilactobacillus bombintestini]
MKVIVVGSSHGGYEAVRGMLLENPDAEIQWYERGDFISFLSCGMELYLEGVVKDVNKVSYETPENAEKDGVHVFVKQEVASIDAANHQVHVKNLADGSERDEGYDKLILAIGAVPRRLDIPGKDLENIYAMRGRDWAIKLKQKMVDPDLKHVFVIGSGYIGIEAAESFAKAGKEVTIIDHNSRLLGNYLDPEFTEILTHEFDDHGVKFVGDVDVQEFVGKDGKVSGVKTNKGNFDAELVVETAGVVANTKLLDGVADLDDHGLIKVDEHQQTSQADIYAAGDSTMVPFAPTGDLSYIALASNARRQGRVAAANAAGRELKMTPVSGSSALSVFSYHFASTGVKEDTQAKCGVKNAKSVLIEDFAVPPFVSEAAGNAKVQFKLTFDADDGRILGGQIMSKRDVTANINTISFAIQQHATVYDLAYADFFFQPGFDRPWNIMNEAAQAAVRKLNK